MATNWTPRSAIVLAAFASSSVPISSITMTSGIWFSTASIITSCCFVGDGTCILRALPIALCGMSPSPAISLEVSTTITRFPASSANTLATSLNIVVFPTPGLPRSNTLSPERIKSSIIFIVPYTALPTLKVIPTIFPARFLIAEMR